MKSNYLGQNGWRKYLSFPLPHILLTEIMGSILLVCVRKGKEFQKGHKYGTGLFHLGAKISQSLTESFRRRISVLKFSHLAAVATCILRVLTRAEPDVQSIRPFVINNEYRKEKRKDKEEQEIGKLLDYFPCLCMWEGLTFLGLCRKMKLSFSPRAG